SVFLPSAPKNPGTPRLSQPETEPDTVAAGGFAAAKYDSSPSANWRFGMGLSARRRKPEPLLLCRPGDREVHGPDQPMGGQFGRLPSRGDRFDYVRREQGKRQ